MKNLFTLLIIAYFHVTSIAQPTIDGDMTSGYGAALATTNSNNCFMDTEDALGSIYVYTTNTEISIGVTGGVGTNNKLILFFDFSGYVGRAAGQTLNAIAGDIDGAKFSNEIDFAIVANEASSGSDFFVDGYRFGTGGGFLNGYFGNPGQSGSSGNYSTASAWGGSGNITIAYKSGGPSSSKGMEVKIPYTAFPGVTNAETLKLFALLTGNSGYVSNESIPGMPSGSCPAVDPDLSSSGTPFSSSFALPITLTKFTATPRSANENILAWTTATEKDNEYFAVQRSADGDKYDQIGRVQGAGTTATEQNYTFSDMAPLTGINYYRLAAVATNGDIDYSPVVTVNNKRKELNSFAVVPNRVQDIALVKIDASKEMNLEIMLVDQVGRIITRSTYELVKGENAINIDLSTLAKGVYFLKAGEQTAKLVRM